MATASLESLTELTDMEASIESVESFRATTGIKLSDLISQIIIKHRKKKLSSEWEEFFSIETTHKTFPSELREREKIIYPLMSEQKWVGSLLAMSEEPQLAHKIMKSADLLFSKFSTYKNGMQKLLNNHLIPAGLVRAEEIVLRANEKPVRFYSLTKEGVEYGQSIAAYTMVKQVQGIPLSSLLGTVAKGSRAISTPLARVRVVQAIMNGRQSQRDIAEELALDGIKGDVVRSSMEFLASHNYIKYQVLGEPVYRWVGPDFSRHLIPRSKGQRKVAAYLKNNSPAAVNQIVEECEISVEKVRDCLDRLSKKGLVETPYEETARSYLQPTARFKELSTYTTEVTNLLAGKRSVISTYGFKLSRDKKILESVGKTYFE